MLTFLSLHWFTFNSNTSTQEVVNNHNCRDSSRLQGLMRSLRSWLPSRPSKHCWPDLWEASSGNSCDVFLTCQGAKMVIGQFSWGWHWRKRRSVSGVGEGGGWRPSRPPSNSPKPHHTPSPNIIQGRSLNCQLLANNYSTQIKLLIHFKYQSVKQSEHLFVCHYFLSLLTLLDFGGVTTK